MHIDCRRVSALIMGLVCGIIINSLCSSANAANFDIQPVRIELNSSTRLGKLVIRNVSETDLPIQVRAYEWSQNENGEDVYRETQDIIVFPKIMTIGKNEERFIRLGSNVRSEGREKTYRVYVEELPLDTSANDGANVRLFMKIGVPVFVAPVKDEGRVDIEAISMNEGKVRLKVKNVGNVHSIVTGVSLRGHDSRGQESFTREIAGWYLLSGTEKIYESNVPSNPCVDLTGLNIELKTNRATIRKEFPVEKSMCEASVTAATSR